MGRPRKKATLNGEVVELTKEILEDLYLNQKKSVSYIANVYGINCNTVASYFKDFGIAKRSVSEITKKELEDLYFTKKQPVKDIAAYFGISTSSLYQLFFKYDILKRPNSAKVKTKIDLTSQNSVNLLRKFYYEEKLCYIEIGQRFNISASKVYFWLKSLDMLDRSPIERKVKENISKNEMVRLYVLEGKTLLEISEMHKTSPRKLKKLLKHYGLSQSLKKKKNAYLELDKEEIKKLYVDQNMTAIATAEALDVSVHTLRQALIHHGFELKPVPSKNRTLDRDEIEALYIKEDISLSDLAKRYEMSYITMARFLRKNGIRKLPVVDQKPTNIESTEEISEISISNN